MEKKVFLKELVESGRNIRKEIISKVVCSDRGVYPIGELWDANKTVDTIVNGASIAFDTLKETEQKLNQLDAAIANESSRARTAEQAEAERAAAAEQALDAAKADKATTLEGYGIIDAYTKQEVDNKIGDLGDLVVPDVPEYWTVGDRKFNYDPTYEYSMQFDYVHDEASWNDSYENGGLKLYYEAYPEEDLWNTVENRPANINDRAADGTYPNCIHCWKGAINAPGAKYPWIVVYFDQPENAKLIFEYEGKEPVMPWGDRIFGNGEGQKVWGCASIPVELGEEFLLDNEGNTTFDVTKFKLKLNRQEVVYHEAEQGYTIPHTVKSYVDTKIAEIIDAISHGTILPGSVDTVAIKDGTIQMEDLSQDVKNKLGATVDEEGENAYIG